MIDTVNTLTREFERRTRQYEQFMQHMHELVTKLLRATPLRVHSISCRLKDPRRLARKLTAHPAKYLRLGEVTDLVGIRIITYFADDVDTIADLLIDQFAIDRQNSIDKRAVIDPDRFGYLSLHYVVMLNEKRSALAEYQGYVGLKAEVQIRSILQHAWAEIEHDLGYKAARGVPRSARRKFSRVAGLLETADADFITIRNDLTSYELTLDSVRATPELVPIDKSAIRALLEVDPYVRALDATVAAICGSKIEPPDDGLLAGHATALRAFGIESIADLCAVLQEREPSVVAFARDWLIGQTAPVAAGISLLYLEYVLAGHLGDEATIAQLADTLNIGAAAQRASVVERIARTYAKVTSGA